MLTLKADICRTDPKDYVRDGASADTVGRFLIELAYRLPKLMNNQVRTLSNVCVT
jgi:condensin complex subunit 1